MPDLTEAEKRAFAFGAMMNRFAKVRCEGRLEDAYKKYAAAEEIEQHQADLAAIRPQNREAYVAAIREAGGNENPWA